MASDSAALDRVLLKDKFAFSARHSYETCVWLDISDQKQPTYRVTTLSGGVPKGVCDTYRKLPNGTYKYSKIKSNKTFILLCTRKYATIKSGTPDLPVQAAGADAILLSRFINWHHEINKNK